MTTHKIIKHRFIANTSYQEKALNLSISQQHIFKNLDARLRGHDELFMGS